jgi:ParB family chromosome partitioning protein
MADVKKTDLLKVPFSLLIVREGFNLRTDYGNMEELVESIRENGIKQPLRGYRDPDQKDRFIVVEGHRRHKAMSILMAEGVEVIAPFVLESQKYSDEQRVVDMFVMNDGKNLTPLEKAEGVRRMINYGYSEKDIAQKIGKSISYVSRLNTLNVAPKRLTKLVENGKISGTFAMDIIQKGETETFLANVEAGFFDAHKNGTDTEELFKEEDAGPIKLQEKITKKSLGQLNSWKEFKKWARNADENLMDEDKAKFFKYLCRIMNNEVDEKSFQKFFR